MSLSEGYGCNQKHKRGPWTQKGNEKFKAHRAVTATATRTWEDKDQMSLSAFRGHVGTLISDPDLQSCERIDLRCFKAPYLEWLVKANLKIASPGPWVFFVALYSLFLLELPAELVIPIPRGPSCLQSYVLQVQFLPDVREIFKTSNQDSWAPAWTLPSIDDKPVTGIKMEPSSQAVPIDAEHLTPTYSLYLPSAKTSVPSSPLP